MAKTASAKFPNWQPGGGADFLNKFNTPDAYKYLPAGSLGVPTVPTGAFDTGSALPSVDPAVKSALDFAKGLAPLQRQQLIDAAQIQQQLNEQGFASAYPWISQAAAESTARNLAASQAYRAFAEAQPSNVQNIMASKQAQMASAAGAEADRARAMAAQQQAAKEFAGRYSGTTFSVG